MSIFKKNKIYTMKNEDATKTLDNILKACNKKPVKVDFEAIKKSKQSTSAAYFNAIAIGIIVLIITILMPLAFLKGSVVRFIFKVPYKDTTSYSSVKTSEELEDGPTAASASGYSISTIKGSRDNTPVVLKPSMNGKVSFKSDICVIDASNANEGYIYARYTGPNPKVKLQITGPDTVTYTYNMKTGGGAFEVFPLSAGDGEYLLVVYENISGNQYSVGFTTNITATLRDPFLPYLYPNQYVWFEDNFKSIDKGKELAFSANSDLDVIRNVYNYMISNITYDYDKAENVKSGYVPDIDIILDSKTGICLDYACLMASILRSQRIPTHMEVGYAGTQYHAWISCYVDDSGWVNGIVQFNGSTWQLMDPTFGSTTPEKTLRSYIANSSNYNVKYIY